MNLPAKLLISGLLIALVVISWSGILDRAATTHADKLLTKALATYAITRTLNGVISVAQGTEIAVQPVGVGLTITAGEILDPLNDLIERFSWLVLAACASLGVQLLLTEIMGNLWVSALLTAATVFALIMLWRPSQAVLGRIALRVCAAMIFARFLVALVTFGSAWLHDQLLDERQNNYMHELSQISEGIEGIETPTSASSSSSSGLLEQLSDFMTAQKQSLDVQSRLERLQERVEAVIAQLLNLIVVFIVQTAILPTAGMALGFYAFRAFWSAAGRHRA